MLWRSHYFLYSRLWRSTVSLPLIIFSLFISYNLWIFLSYMYGEMRSFRMQLVELSMAFIWVFCSSRWFSFRSMHHVSILFFNLPIYFPLHEQSKWYISGWLFGSSFGLFFWHRICCRFFPTWRQYLSLFSWTHVLFSDWRLESKVISIY